MHCGELLPCSDAESAEVNLAVLKRYVRAIAAAQGVIALCPLELEGQDLLTVVARVEQLKIMRGDYYVTMNARFSHEGIVRYYVATGGGNWIGGPPLLDSIDRIHITTPPGQIPSIDCQLGLLLADLDGGGEENYLILRSLSSYSATALPFVSWFTQPGCCPTQCMPLSYTTSTKQCENV